eukprot:7391502-Prymnesium_polylepis.1
MPSYAKCLTSCIAARHAGRHERKAMTNAETERQWSTLTQQAGGGAVAAASLRRLCVSRATSGPFNVATRQAPTQIWVPALLHGWLTFKSPHLSP